MRAEHIQLDQDPVIRQAAAQLKKLIRVTFPGATFVVTEGDDPKGMYVHVTVDVDDLTTVLETVADQLFAYQVEQELAIYVVPQRPLHRTLLDIEGQEQDRHRGGRHRSPAHA